MKHNWKITIILLFMFLITQLIGLGVITSYQKQCRVFNETTQKYENQSINLPYGMEPPEIKEDKDFLKVFSSIIFAFIVAITIVFIITKYKWKFLIKAWFFIVICLALGITIGALINFFYLKVGICPKQALSIPIPYIIATIIAIPLAFLKIYKPNVILHNITELLIYPGIAAVFVPILNITTVILFLILISLYDMWAVWHSGIMQKMAKFQMEELKIFGGFLVPYIPKKLREKIKKLKKSKSKKAKKIKISLAILGGGDIVFPIITAGVFLIRTQSLLYPIFIILGAFFGLFFLFIRSEKKKFYPAMPFLTAGMFLGIILAKLISVI